jgi:hypothetical protein
MHISFERSGGFTGIPITVTVDSSTLSPNEAAQLHQLVDMANFFQLPETIPAPDQPDRFQYSITVEEGDRRHIVTVGEAAVPNTLRPLLNWLMEAARRR